jgi:ferredoxin
LYSGVIDKEKFTSITDKASTQNIDLILKCQGETCYT